MEIRTKIRIKNILFNRLIISFKRYNKSLKGYKIEWKLNKRNRMEIKSRKNRKEIETTNMSFKRLLIFPFQYLFSRIEIKLIKSFVQLKNLDLTTQYRDISIYSWPLVGGKNQPNETQHYVE